MTAAVAADRNEVMSVFMASLLLSQRLGACPGNASLWKVTALGGRRMLVASAGV